ncbi:GntR family transcriptional regulator [Streptomonospora sp. NEAU-YY374]|nr:GntR family transcriptional regulator [Streptomonospora nanhaiensis]
MEPRHLVIARALLSEIDGGRYEPGDSLPTEEQLMASYGTSRNTVRRALQELANRGRIDIKQGSGSTVRRPRRPIVHVASSIEGIPDDERYARYVERMSKEQTEEPRLRFQARRGPAGGRIARLLRIDPNRPGAFVLCRRCDRMFGARLWERQLSYYPGHIAEGSELETPEDIPTGTKEVLAAMGYPQTRHWDVIRAEMPSIKDSDRFGMGPGIPLLVHERLAFSGDTPIRYTVTRMPADRHHLMYVEGDTSEDDLLDALQANTYDD